MSVVNLFTSTCVACRRTLLNAVIEQHARSSHLQRLQDLVSQEVVKQTPADPLNDAGRKHEPKFEYQKYRAGCHRL